MRYKICAVTLRCFSKFGSSLHSMRLSVVLFEFFSVGKGGSACIALVLLPFLTHRCLIGFKAYRRFRLYSVVSCLYLHLLFKCLLILGDEVKREKMVVVYVGNYNQLSFDVISILFLPSHVDVASYKALHGILVR